MGVDAIVSMRDEVDSWPWVEHVYTSPCMHTLAVSEDSCCCLVG